MLGYVLLVAVGCSDCPDGILRGSPGVRVRAGTDAASSQAQVYATVYESYFFDDHGGDETGCTTRDSSSIQVSPSVAGAVTELGAARELDLPGLAPEYVFHARRGGDEIETVARSPSFYTVTMSPDPPLAGQPLTLFWSSHGDPDSWLCIDVHDLFTLDACSYPPELAPFPQGRTILARDTGEVVIEGFDLFPQRGEYEIAVHRVRQAEVYERTGYQAPWVDLAYALRRTVR